jgi:cobalt-zinc-cadmium efflux system membrane fusion protein
LTEVQRQGPGGGQGLHRGRNRRGQGQGWGAQGGNRQQTGYRQGLSGQVELTPEEEEAIGLVTEPVNKITISEGLNVMGKVLANQNRKAIVSYPFPARVSEIYARVGDYVRKGVPLIVLQSEEVGEATSGFYKCSADYELARLNFEREQRLFEKGVGAKKDFLTSEADLKVAEANLNAAEKKLHVLGFSEEEVRNLAESHRINPSITLYAPLSGKIVSGSMVLGSMVDETTEIMTIMDPSLLWIEAEVYEKDISRVKTGQEVTFSVPAYPDEVFSGKLIYISDILNETTRTITLRTEVGNPDGKLKPGMFANLVLSVGNTSTQLAVPASAILEESGQKTVFVKEQGHFTVRPVRTGPGDKDHVAVLTGLREGEVVVTKGGFQLKSKLREDVLKNSDLH